MSDVTEMAVKFKPEVTPFQADPRNMGPVKKEAMRQKIIDFISMGKSIRDPDPYYASPAFMVPKPNGKWLTVVTLRHVNQMVEINVGGLPNLEVQLAWLPKRPAYFSLLDALFGFDMLRVNPECTNYFAISTIFGVHRNLVVPMGFGNTPFIYQERIVTKILGDVQAGAMFGRPHSSVLK